MPVTPDDDFPHAVDPRAFMTWKENWVFPGVDLERRAAVLFHFSLRPALGEGIFTAKAHSDDGIKIRYVGRSPVPADLRELRPVADAHVRFEVLEPAQRFHLVYRNGDDAIDVTFTARFAPWDFADGPKPAGESVLGPIGKSVFPFHHYEQALAFEGTMTQGGRTVAIAGWGNRDHSWGWRDDFAFRKHHWVCASFADKFVQGSTMLETYFPQQKHGGFVSRASGNDGVRFVDTSDNYWEEPLNEPLPALVRPVDYAISTVDGDTQCVRAHIDEAIAVLYLNARSPDRSQVYQDAQIFCPFTDLASGERGGGVLELGKHLHGDGIADRVGRR